jgi:hypothetical protein
MVKNILKIKTLLTGFADYTEKNHKKSVKINLNNLINLWTKVFCQFFLFCIFCSIICFAQESDFKELKCDHFIIYYSPAVGDNYAYGIRDIAEQFFSRITEEFNLIRGKLWLWENRAKIYVARDRDDYSRRFNCPQWSGACVDYRERLIYTYPNQNRFSAILAHELTHIIFREYVGEKNFPLWLDEAVAMYIEDKYNNGAHQGYLPAAKVMIRDNNYIPFEKLNKIDGLFLNSQPQEYADIFYIESFSLINFMIKDRGRDTFNYFLFCLRNDATLEEALIKSFGVFTTMKNLEDGWKKFYQE